jgi:hypothetical protein
VWCPACDGYHTFDDRWTFNGDKEKPTFRASMLAHAICKWNPEKKKFDVRDVHCHSYLTDGVWEYQDDSKHDMKNTKVPAPDFPLSQA